MLDAVCVDSKDKKRIVAIKPKPVLKALFRIADIIRGYWM